MKLYKLTNNKSETYNNTKWAVGVKHRIFKRGHELCSDQVFHVYRHPVQAVFFNPIHANIDNPRLFEVRTGKIVADDGTKVGVKTIEVIREMVLPKLSREQHITIAIKCAKLVVDDKVWNLWADNWLSGKDRSEAAARAAAWEARVAAGAAAEAAAGAARAAAGAEGEEAAARAMDKDEILKIIVKEAEQ